MGGNDNIRDMPADTRRALSELAKALVANRLQVTK